MKYAIVTHTIRNTTSQKDGDAFLKEVHSYVEQGFKPLGGVSVSRDGNCLQLAQALTMEDAA